MKFIRWRSAKTALGGLALVLIIACTAASAAAASSGVLALTEAEKQYIAASPVLRVMFIDGAAPIQFADKNGELQGISKLVLEGIATMTGLNFEYIIVEPVQEVWSNQDADIVAGILTEYASMFSGIIFSDTYVKSATIHYLHKSIDIQDLADKTYAAVYGSPLPAGVTEANVIYYDCQDAALDAVNSGRADYGYGSAYSVAYYTLQNGYRNLVSVPVEKHPRLYKLGLLEPNDMLMSIINKAIDAIDADKMQEIILSATSRVERQLTLPMIIEAYGTLFYGFLLILVFLFLLWLFSSLTSKAELKLQNQRYEILASLSNEFIFEFDLERDELMFCRRRRDFFDSNYTEIISQMIKESLLPIQLGITAAPPISIIKLPKNEKGIDTLQLVASYVYDDHGYVQSIIGKLVDITEAAAEKEALITRAQVDGLTGLLNSITTRELVEARLESKNAHELDAFLLLDIDSFKLVNDNLGHYTGDKVLQDLASAISATFRKTDIIGRHGGDEFSIYLKNVPSEYFVAEKCRELVAATRQTVGGITVLISVGATVISDPVSFAEIFQLADRALYQAKAMGTGQIVVL